ncbi:ATP-binding protein [Paenibacillus sp. URB8-2]|uniref:ATP-binding protein n=1 Tax=Paenibacillus sp. URB8-2 TaxID=2741301 RepID=UPI0015C2859C|nr:ATP-binding protein [Paenibacillus sp. URB8-2]BCG58117.1 ATP-binding protein [Paenibacillus sp. URB8-2]
MNNISDMVEIDGRDFRDLDEAFEASLDFVQKNYLDELHLRNVVPVPKHISELTTRNNIRLFKMNKLVFDKKENNLDKIMSVYNTLGNVYGSLVMIINSDGNRTDLYLGTRTNSKEHDVNSSKEALKKSFEGNFPGSDIENLTNNEIEKVISSIFTSELSQNENSVSSVSGVPSLKDQDKAKFVQGLEKLVDAMKGEEFSAIFIADPVSHRNIEEIKLGYENLYSQLVPFAKSDLSFNSSDSIAISEGITKGVTETINESLTKTQSYTQGSSEAESHTESHSKTTNWGGALAGIGAAGGFLIGGPMGAVVAGGVSGAVGSLIGSSTDGSTHAHSKTTNQSKTDGESEMRGRSDSTSTQESSSEVQTIGNSRNLQIQFENKTVTNLLQKIDEQLLRLKSSEDFGMWTCACYFIAPSVQTSRVAASTYKAIMRGENSAIENSFINTWDNNNKANLLEVGKYLKKFNHPLIEMKVNTGLNLPHISPGSLINGKELAIQLGFPQKSLSGLPVIETAEFGRNIVTYDLAEGNRASFKLGNVFHMGKSEDTSVEIDVNSLAMHTFVTGSTGSGKSNTIYQMMNELVRKNIHFLVIEPAKGEYKNIFGGRKDVSVFGTNSNFTDLLRINPFRFPLHVHVLEHIDRIIEIFNACWPMYAAMPAVLKEAIERTYISIGWDIEDSFYFGDEIQYPTFYDLLTILPVVIKESAYSEEVKSNYIGALVTRVKSMTNGLFGKIFTDDEIESEVLFDKNCIIDLSRVGSIETKALIMGILFMRLQEYRMSNDNPINSDLKHVTVIEEAHHLLRRVSSEQSQEGANLQGKSVEMIANAIAEMRTYGEGFIIADQAPNLLDRSVIRNTNTKIILRLPDELDRSEVGKTANLNENQMNELPKLRTGVAAVYQNNWLQPVLCEVNEFNNYQPYSLEKKTRTIVQPTNREMLSNLLELLLVERVSEKNRKILNSYESDRLKKWLLGFPVSHSIKQSLIHDLDYFESNNKMQLWEQKNFVELSKIVSSLIPQRLGLIQYAKNAANLEEWNRRFTEGLRKYITFKNPEEYELAVMQCLLQDKAQEDAGFRDFYYLWVEECKEGGKSVC